MARIRQARTGPEEQVAAILRKLGLNFRKNVKGLPGSPDFANRRGGWAIFVNGCFWHHHKGCSKATIPKTNSEFWLRKFRDNRRRDAAKAVALRRMGFRVAIVWQCRISGCQPRLEQPTVNLTHSLLF
jgi:DNA mismatch endonuclease Vsr